MAKSNVGIGEDWARAPPPSGPVWRTIGNALYNHQEKSLLGRTPKRWGIVLTFYMVFYAVLALMFSACMGGLFLTIDLKKPSYTLGQSLIGANPGVASRPRPDDGFQVTLDASNSSVQQFFVDQLELFLLPYQHSKKYKSELCSAEDKYGYPNTPCFFIKLNKIIGWQPECYNDISNLPEDMPDDLRDYIKMNEAEPNQIWMDCWEEKNNQTKIEYPLGRGISADNYPYMNDHGYNSPILAIKLTPPVNKLVIVRCRFWAKNIIYNKSIKEPSGYTRVHLQVVDTTSFENENA